LLKGQNDSVSHAEKLGILLNPLLCHLNLIPVNPTLKSDYKRSNLDNINNFRKVIENYGIPSTIRMEKGIDINAGCGQLKSEYIELES
jgi:23S rRNA (adenine2503-C2)-methyltransferase